MGILQAHYTLSNGVQIPKLGLGTWQVSDEDVVRSVTTAIRHGYRHIDTACAYQNESGVGKAVSASGLKRNEVFVTTKIPDLYKTYDEAKACIQASLKRLNLGYIDLLLIHCPKSWKDFFEGSDKTYFDENISVWRAMEEAYKEGLVKAIGVSNFLIEDIRNIADHCEIAPMVNQIKYHIGWTQNELTAFCQKNNLLIEGFSPNATSELMKNEKVGDIARKYDKSIPQLGIRYALQKDVLPLPKSTHEEYIVENSQLDFAISPEDMEYLDHLTSSYRIPT